MLFLPYPHTIGITKIVYLSYMQKSGLEIWNTFCDGDPSNSETQDFLSSLINL